MSRTSLIAAFVLVAALVMAVPAAPRAQAADVSVTLHAENFTWHVGTNTSASTTITVNAGDTIRLQITDHDDTAHTFTAPQFGVDAALPASQTIFVNITTDAGDVGTWQFYCIPHSTGTYPNRGGMIGSIVVQSTTPPPPPDNTLLYGGIGIVLVVVVVAALAVMMRKKKSGGPGTGGPQQP